MTPPFARDVSLCLCHHCKLACPLEQGIHACPRCATRLRQRRPNALARPWALMLAALVLYIPANTLPIVHTTAFQHDSATTIIGSVIALWQDDAWDIALIIFIASIGVPVTKFLALGLLLVTVQRRSDRSPRQRTVLYRGLELIGYWSMLDVFVTGLLVALVQFGAQGAIEPGSGILFFGLVVILTMLATLSFDPRLIWDTATNHE